MSVRSGDRGAVFRSGGVPALLAIVVSGALLLSSSGKHQESGSRPSRAVAAPAAPAAPPAISLQFVTAVPANPLGVVTAGDGSGRLFIVRQQGTLEIYTGATLLATPFLNISTIVSTGPEQGLLGLAFHPDYESNGFFFINYTDVNGDTVIARYKVSATNPNLADTSSRVPVLAIDQPFVNHNGGHLLFGPDGYLYIGMGDGGSGNDPNCFAQRDDALLGKILRIDVDQNVTQPPYHGIPPSNPFAGAGHPKNKFWARGLRNPWQFTFDRVTGDLFIADVGELTIEEVNFQPAASPGGENYGWKMMEGPICGTGGTAGCPMGIVSCNHPSLIRPILSYDHTLGCSVTGGFRYRGSLYPQLYGVYLYGDYCTGRIWGATQDAAGNWSATELLHPPIFISSFGEDEVGNIYVVNHGGTIYRVTSTTDYPVPAVAGTSPGSAIAGDPGVSLTVRGSGFHPDSIVRWNGAGRPTAYVSPFELTASISAADLDTIGTASVTVFNPAPAGGVSNARSFDINPTFLDVPASYWASSQIETIADAGITSGCGGRRYCPELAVTRAQMAVFLLRGVHGSSYMPPAASGTVFSDVPASAFAAAWIEQLAEEGVTTGCGGGKYCPNASVTREQMAVFLLRAKHGSAYVPPAADGDFDDVPVSSPYARWIEQLAAEGITSGCGGSNFCPTDPVTRGQMAVFLVNAFGLP
jgi:glucose/arabinose dehydrogenase